MPPTRRILQSKRHSVLIRGIVLIRTEMWIETSEGIRGFGTHRGLLITTLAHPLPQYYPYCRLCCLPLAEIYATGAHAAVVVAVHSSYLLSFLRGVRWAGSMNRGPRVTVGGRPSVRMPGEHAREHTHSRVSFPSCFFWSKTRGARASKGEACYHRGHAALLPLCPET